MQVVLEEVEETIARLIPDDGSSPIHVPVEQLPDGYEIGTVYELVNTEGDPQLVLLSEETENRRKRIRSKREALLKRSRKKQ